MPDLPRRSDMHMQHMRHMPPRPQRPRRPAMQAGRALAGLVAAVACAALQAAAPAGPVQGLEGLPYAQARARIIAGGWTPVHSRADFAWERDIQKRYPELAYCAVDQPWCSLFFRAPSGACLRVVTRGEQVTRWRVHSVSAECD